MKTRLLNGAAPALLALALSGSLCLAAPASAQNTGPTGGGNAPPPPAGAPTGAAAQPSTGTAAAPTPATGTSAAPTKNEHSEKARLQQRIDRLHRQLKITPAQQQEWTQFTDVMRANAESTEQLYKERNDHFQTMNAVEGLQNYQQIVQTRAQDLAKLVTAFQGLYNTLSPEQKQIADQLFHYQEERREQRHMTHHG